MNTSYHTLTPFCNQFAKLLLSSTSSSSSSSSSLLLFLFHHCLLYQGSHTHILETNHVPRGYIVAAILSLLFMVPQCLVPALVLLFFYVSTFRSMCAMPNMAVFCSSLTSWFPGMSFTYFLNDLEMVPVAPIITRITTCFYIPHALYFCCEVFIF